MSASPNRLSIPLSQIPAHPSNNPSTGSGSGSSLNNYSSLTHMSSSTSGPLPPRLRSALNTALLSSNSIPAIQAALLHECQATGFITAVRARVRELLRSGQCGSYGEAMGRIMAEIRGEEGAMVNGAGAGAGAGDKGERLKVPTRVIEEGVRVVRAALEGVVEIGDD